MDENRPLMLQLAHILYRRNKIETRRRKAKSKIGYYQELKRIIKAYKKTASEEFPEHVRQLELNKFKTSKMRPFKWLNRVSELNKRILKHRAEYMKARYDTAKLTCSTRKHVASITKSLCAHISYKHGTGFVGSFSVHLGATPVYIHHDEFESMFNEVEAARAVESMLKGRYDKKQEEEKTN